jgi:hypothetical protein
MANLVLARVKNTPSARKHGVFANSVRMFPGETAWLDLDELGIKSLKDSRSWEEASADEATIQPMPIAPVAPHAPGATEPQVLPAGARIRGTGGHIIPGSGTDAVSLRPMAPEAAAELSAQLPEPEAQPSRSEGGEGTGEPSLLDNSVPTLRQELAKIDDLGELRRLRDQEVGGKSRSGALEAIDDRILAVEEKSAE